MAGGHLTAANENGRRKTQWPSSVERDRRCDRRLRNSSNRINAGPRPPSATLIGITRCHQDHGAQTSMNTPGASVGGSINGSRPRSRRPAMRALTRVPPRLG
jgi:hypothetical protein